MKPSKFQVVLTPSFERGLKKILKKDKKIVDIFEIIIKVLAVDPFNKSRRHDVKKLVDVKQGEGQWRIRFRNYRFRYDIIKKQVVLHIVKDRKEVY